MMSSSDCPKKALLVLAATTYVVAAADVRTMQIHVPEGVDLISYDASRVEPEELRHWLTLSPIISQNTNLLVPENVSLCDIEDHGYTGCGQEQVTLNLANAKHGVERIRSRLKKLNESEFPSDFAPIVDYFRTVQSFGLWRNQREIAYFETKDVSHLESKYGTLDPKTSCAAVLDQVRRAGDGFVAWNIVKYKWENCVWLQAHKTIGDYPQDVWNAALARRGIRERLVLEEN